MHSTLNEVLARLDRDDSGITFRSGGAGLVSYATLGRLVRSNAAHFAALGVRRGERVAISIDSDVEHVTAFLALIAVGALPLSVKPRRGSPHEYRRYIGRLVERHRVDRVYATMGPYTDSPSIRWTTSTDGRDAIVDVDASDIAFVQFSSGSLGDPKAIPIRHESLVDNIASILAVDARSPGYRGSNVLPLSHDMGLVGGLLSNLALQNPLLLGSVAQFFRRPTEFVRGANGIALPDFALRYLARYLDGRDVARDAFAAMGTIYCGAEPISARAVHGFLASAERLSLLPSALVFAYGLAEATLIVTARRYDGASFDGSVRHVANLGRPMRGTEVMVRGDHVMVRGPGVLHGYLDEEPRSEDWFDTGDLGRIRDGDLFITGRAKDLVIVNGENLFPADIEELVARAPGVSEPLVMAEDDGFYLFVVPDVGGAPSAEDIAALVAGEFGAAPKAIAFGAARDVLRTTSGKPMRAMTLDALRQRGVIARCG